MQLPAFSRTAQPRAASSPDTAADPALPGPAGSAPAALAAAAASASAAAASAAAASGVAAPAVVLAEAAEGLPVCLVTGGTGLLGNAIKRRLLLRGNACRSSSGDSSQSVSCRERSGAVMGGQTVEAEGYRFVFVGSSQADLRSAAATESLFARYQPTALLHLAARVGGLFSNIEHNLKFLEENLQINESVVRAAHKHRVKTAIFCLSTCVFPAAGAPDGQPMREEFLHNGPPHASNEGYAHAKRILEVTARLHAQQFKYAWRCVCPTNLYGPHDNFSLSAGHVLPALVHKAFLAQQGGGKLTAAGSGRPLRQFLYADDCAEIMLRLLLLPDSTPLLFFNDAAAPAAAALQPGSAALSPAPAGLLHIPAGAAAADAPAAATLSAAQTNRGLEVAAAAPQQQQQQQRDNGGVPFLLILAADGPDSEVSIRDLAMRIAEEFDLQDRVEFDASKPDGVYKKTVSTARLRKFLGPEFSFTPLSQGIHETCKWFKENSDSGALRR